MDYRLMAGKLFFDQSIDDRSVLGKFIDDAYSQPFVKPRCSPDLNAVIK
jgi:hypothetical protein